MSEEIAPEAAQDLPAVADADRSHAGGRDKIPLVDDETGAAGQRVADEPVTVRPDAGDRHKKASRFTLP
jgi:hypothetical protein